eukprot:CAMPEP_0181492854 /NCGR_PEP_ID=MMETSP1110-20121109/50911_1 /TAXON_ID=174948 /ORGANISM="Symbiodinium sp., Strain CCMP421" /LENGTH=33 /DNA_ID= /DNA_START= /DNA_END= /DNA_ORIENTATION=
MGARGAWSLTSLRGAAAESSVAIGWFLRRCYAL